MEAKLSIFEEIKISYFTIGNDNQTICFRNPSYIYIYMTHTWVH